MLEGKLVRLRPLEAADCKLLAVWRNAHAESFFGCWPVALSEQQRWYDRYLGGAKERMFMVETTEKREPVGCLGFTEISQHHQSAEIGRVMFINEGKGYAAEAMKLLLEFGFQEVNLNRIALQVLAHNQHAVKFYEKCGFQKEGVLREAIFKEGGRRDVLIMSVLRSEWNA